MWNLYKLGWIVAFWTAGLSACTLPCSAQGTSSSQESAAKPPDGRSRVQSHHSVTVTATYTPEEKEDWKINEVYQPIFSLEQKGDCEAAIHRYKLELVPLAEKSKFEIPKNKFLFLANRGIGNCYMAQRQYEAAEQSFRQILEYMPIWPGLDDSDYPINFQQLGTAQIGQQHWDAAEESLKKSVSLFDPQIDNALKSDSEFVRTEHVGHLYRGKARSLAYIGVVYLREGRPVEALKTADLAYNVATQPNVPPKFATEIVQVGRMIAQATGDEDAMAKWSQREPPEK